MTARTFVSGRSRSQSNEAVERLRRVARPVLRAYERWRARASRRRIGIALVYHRIAATPGDPERELVPAIAAGVFDEQVRRVRRHYRLVSASALVREVRRRRFCGRIPVAITFDDDLRSHVEHAAPALGRVGAPATFFLCGASLDRPQAFWWQDLEHAVGAGLPGVAELPFPAGVDVDALRARTPRSLRRASRAIEEAPPHERAALATALRELVGRAAPADALDAADVRALARAGFEIGFHTRTHEPLPTLADDVLADAVHDSRAALEACAGAPLRVLAYPHGRADARVADAARAAGYTYAFTGVPEAIHTGSNPWLLGRVEPSHRSADELDAQLGRLLRR